MVSSRTARAESWGDSERAAGSAKTNRWAGRRISKRRHVAAVQIQNDLLDRFCKTAVRKIPKIGGKVRKRRDWRRELSDRLHLERSDNYGKSTANSQKRPVFRGSRHFPDSRCVCLNSVRQFA